MATARLKTARELMPEVTRILDTTYHRLAVLLPHSELHHIGATAIPESLTKGDVDVLVRVSPEQFRSAVEVLQQNFEVKQPENWSDVFASFGDDCSHALPLGIQLVVRDSDADFLLFLRDHFITNRDALEDYNRLKLTYADQGPDAYWTAKDAFLSGILAGRDSQELGGTD